MSFSLLLSRFLLPSADAPEDRPAMWFAKKSRVAKLLKSGAPRRIRVHSLHPQPADAPKPTFVRIAFEFLDPPGPWSMQFYEATPEQPELLALLTPGTEARFLESEDGARTRVLVTADGRAVWPY
jgi:hypothetical protein